VYLSKSKVKTTASDGRVEKTFPHLKAQQQQQLENNAGDRGGAVKL
jgi:hypothetical protein